MLKTLATICKDHWEWRGQIARLSLFELKKQSRGAVLGWVWFFIKPAMYIFCFWFALEVGMRVGAGASEGAPPYILWLCAGLIPWFFMQSMLGAGSDVYHRYSYLVNKIKFPLSGISTIYTCGEMIIELLLMVVLFVIYFLCGQGFDIYLIQVPILLVLLFLFWDFASIFFSQFSGMSKDFANLLKAMSTPFFWLSGVIFDVRAIPIDWIQNILYFNPITFFVTAFRGAFYDKVWFWDNPVMLGGFIAVFAITFVAAIFSYKKLSEEIVDVL